MPKVQLASAVLRQLEFARHLKDEEEINRYSTDGEDLPVPAFEQGRPTI